MEYILRELRAEFGDGYVLVFNDGLEIWDSPITRSEAFWRQPQRVFAVPQGDLCEPRSPSAALAWFSAL